MGAHRAQLRRKDEERARAAAAKRVAETAALDRQLRARAANKAAAEQLLSFIERGSDDWEKAYDKHKSAYRCLTDKQLKNIPTSSGGLKKADVVLAITVYRETYQLPAENIIEAPASNALSVLKALEEAPEELAPPSLVVEEPEEPPAMLVHDEPAEVARPRRGIKCPAKFDII